MTNVYYYKVPKKIIYKTEDVFDDNGNIVESIATAEILEISPDIPENIDFIAVNVGDYYHIKTHVELSGFEEITNIHDTLLNSKIRGRW